MQRYRRGLKITRPYNRFYFTIRRNNMVQHITRLAIFNHTPMMS